MKTYDAHAKLFKVLMHPARLQILDLLRSGEECVCHLEAALSLRQAYISQQLMVLKEAGLVQDRRDGWNHFYRITEPGILDLLDAASAIIGESSGDDRKKGSLRSKYMNCGCPKCRQAGMPLGG